MKLIAILLLCLADLYSLAQTCPSAPGDQQTYGTNNQWIGYVYSNEDFTNYHGQITGGNVSDPGFDENFGGDYTNFNTSGCSVYTETFSVRYKLQQNMAPGYYDIAVGADDGFRLSVDGGITWIIDSFSQHNYTVKTKRVYLTGQTWFVLEYFEHEIVNRVSFEMHPVCQGSGSQTVYGNGVWIGYVYDEPNFTAYKGTIGEGSPSNPSFYEDFGTQSGFAQTGSCYFLADSFSVRFRMQQSFLNGNYSFTVGGDDGYRLSFDGGNTWAIENFGKHSYVTSDFTSHLSGTYNMVLEYFDYDGDNILSYQQQIAVLAVTLVDFSVVNKSGSNLLQWRLTGAESIHSVDIERSSDASHFTMLQTQAISNAMINGRYSYVDKNPLDENYYRLKITEKSGEIFYSKTIAINNRHDSFLAYPNPVTAGNLNVLIPASAGELKLTDITGRNLFSKKFPGMGNASWQSIHFPQRLAKGSYILEFNNQEGIRQRKIIVQ